MEITFHAMNKTKRNFEKYSESVFIFRRRHGLILRVAASAIKTINKNGIAFEKAHNKDFHNNLPK
jgi:ribosomal protein L28